MIPVAVGRLLALVSAHRGVLAVAVEIQAVVAGVVEHAVENDFDAARFARGKQGVERFSAAEHLVYLAVVACIVLVIGIRLKDGAEVNAVYRKALEVVQLFDDAPQAAAEKLIVFERSAGVGRVFGDAAVPVLTQDRVLADGRFVRSFGKTIDKDVIHRRVIVALGGGEGWLVYQQQKASGRAVGQREIHVVDAGSVYRFVISFKAEFIVKQSVILVAAERVEIEVKGENIAVFVKTAVFGDKFAVGFAVMADHHTWGDELQFARNMECDFERVLCRKCACKRSVDTVDSFYNADLHKILFV